MCLKSRLYLNRILLMVEEASTRIEACKREKYWKSGVGKEQLKTLT